VENREFKDFRGLKVIRGRKEKREVVESREFKV